MTPTAEGWDVTSLITVVDPAKTVCYRMVGIPEGLGAVAGKFDRNGQYVADDAYMTVFMNHELRDTAGAVRAHGAAGAFVSQWTVHLNSLQVKEGEDLIRSAYVWDGSKFVQPARPVTFNRFCSGDLPGKRAFYNPPTRKGFPELIYMNGEESGAEGRAFAHIVSGDEKGTSYELPYLGKFSWENSVAHPDAGDTTIVVGLDDGAPGQLYVYVGAKQRHGNPAERAGLQYGKLYGVKVPDVPLESAGPISGSFVLEDVSDLATGSGANLLAESVACGITEFARPEDGAWDVKDAKAFYFVTTGATLGGARQTARL